MLLILIKSADPVTYDDNGNVIPLSERFKDNNKDIRYQFAGRKSKTANTSMLPKAENMEQKGIDSAYLEAVKSTAVRYPFIYCIADEGSIYSTIGCFGYSSLVV